MGGKDPQLAGGSLIDMGAYAVNSFRLLAGAAGAQGNFEVINASAVERFPEVDSTLEAQLRVGDIEGSLKSGYDMSIFPLIRATALVVGDKGEMSVDNFLFPFFWHSLTVVGKDGSRRVERLYDEKHLTTYDFQLGAFVDAVRAGKVPGVAGSAEDAIENMKLIDSVYESLNWKQRRGY